jgi:hypothetical protein
MGRMRRTYEEALEAGAFPGSRRVSNEEVARRHRAGQEVNMEAIARVREVLCALGVKPVNFIRYVPFGVRLARICRQHESLTRENLARGLVREWEMRLARRGAELNPPDRAVLVGICEMGFGIRLERGERAVTTLNRVYSCPVASAR